MVQISLNNTVLRSIVFLCVYDFFYDGIHLFSNKGDQNIIIGDALPSFLVSFQNKVVTSVRLLNFVYAMHQFGAKTLF